MYFLAHSLNKSFSLTPKKSFVIAKSILPYVKNMPRIFLYILPELPNENIYIEPLNIFPLNSNLDVFFIKISVEIFVNLT